MDVCVRLVKNYLSENIVRCGRDSVRVERNNTCSCEMLQDNTKSLEESMNAMGEKWMSLKKACWLSWQAPVDRYEQQEEVMFWC